MKFKILHTEASLGWGGQEIRIMQESAGMRDMGNEVIIAADPQSKLLENAKKNNFSTIAVSFKRRNFLPIVLFFKRLIEKEKIDIVNTHSSKDSWLVLPAARLAKNKPFVLRTRHLSTPIGKNILTKFLYDILPHMIITTGEAIKEQMIRENGFNPNKIVSIPTGVDINVFDPEKQRGNLREELNLPPSTPLVGAVSVIRIWKGIDYMVKAAPLILKQMPDVRFVIVGEGPHRKTLEKTIDEVGVNDKVYLLGHREDIVNILKSIDILVHPSYANEGVPQAVLQAMAMKKPVIASNIAPLREVVIDYKTGLLVNIKDPESIAHFVIKLLREKEMADYMGENGRKMVEDSYSFSGMLDKLIALYEKRCINV